MALHPNKFTKFLKHRRFLKVLGRKAQVEATQDLLKRLMTMMTKTKKKHQIRSLLN